MQSLKASNPISIDQLVRRKIEKRACGLLLDTPQSVCETAGRHPQEDKTLNQPDDLKNTFLSLLLAEQTSHHTAHADPAFENNRQSKQVFGTSTLNLPLKKQEDTSQKLSSRNEEFAFSIQDSEAGDLKIKGHWGNGQMKITLSIEKQLDADQKRLLAHFLRHRLSAQLKTSLEVLID